ncbi:MAG: hypothetical protein M1820_003034 [Bogoriella megaspora]|nr:MAG: hypothetical protein M1820_003034 [Bogoriella megaspora]
MAGSVAGIVACGTWFGAGLKTQHQASEKQQDRREATVAERVALLETSRNALVLKKTLLERKIEDYERRRREKEANRPETGS